MWTKVPKPERGISQGQPLGAGFFMFLTYATGIGGAWTDVPKPTRTADVDISAGEAIGLLLALTYAEDSTFSSDEWTKVPKPI